MATPHDNGSDASGTVATQRRTSRPQLRQPLVAELIADTIRERILRGEYNGADSLPKQEDLLEEFNVSKPSVREALRILETEGLIRVRRGSQGGAVVHLPESRDAAYMLGLVLQSKRVGVEDVGAALRRLEPSCAALCAEQDDRTATVDALRSVHQAAEEAVDDEIEFVHQMRRFHEAIVDSCDNETMKVLVGSLTAIWSAEERAWAHSFAGSERYPGTEKRREGLRAHERITELIAEGNADGVLRAYYGHLCASQVYTLASSASEVVDAAVLRRQQFG